jgi:hypothetical protein
MIISRSASLLVAALYVCLASLGKLPHNLVVSIAPALLFGLPLILFPEQIGSWREIIYRRAGTPPLVVALMGWVFLLGFPLLFAALSK